DGVKPSGKGYVALCPAHDDRSPSFSISEAADGRILFYCHAKCKQEDVLNALGLSWTDLFPDKKDNKKARYSPTSKRATMVPTKAYQDHRTKAMVYRENLTPDSLAAQYLAARGIPFSVAKAHGIGYCFGPVSPFGQWSHGWITAPHTLLDGRIVNIYARAVGEDHKLSQEQLKHFKTIKHRHLSCPKGLFNAAALDSDILYITEGVFDALSLLSCGYPAIAIFGLDGLNGFWQYIKAKQLVLCMDSDEKGQEATEHIAMQAIMIGKQV